MDELHSTAPSKIPHFFSVGFRFSLYFFVYNEYNNFFTQGVTSMEKFLFTNVTHRVSKKDIRSISFIVYTNLYRLRGEKCGI